MDTRMCNVQITSPVVILYNACAITMPFCLLERVPLQQLACSQFSHLVFKILQNGVRSLENWGKRKITQAVLSYLMTDYVQSTVNMLRSVYHSHNGVCAKRCYCIITVKQKTIFAQYLQHKSSTCPDSQHCFFILFAQEESYARLFQAKYYNNK